jgi:uncharacterized protein YceK
MYRLILIIVMIFSLSGCATLTKLTKEASKADKKSVTALKKMSKQFLKTWPFYSGMLKGALGNDIDKLPAEAISALEELDQLAGIVVDDGLISIQPIVDPNDYDLGRNLGLRIRVLYPVVTEAIKKVSPDLMDFLPAIL